MLYLLKRHPIAIEAHFQFTLVLTYAFPAELLQGFLFPGLALDQFGELGFVAIALVQTEHLRPKGFPASIGLNFFLSGYRLFTKFRTAAGRGLRGLRILRSDANKPLMCFVGNLMTHYKYELARVEWERKEQNLSISITTKGATADLELTANLDPETARLPTGSPFSSIKDARRFAGPLPFTFDYEEQTGSIIRVEGVRSNWLPQLTSVDVRKATFFNRAPFLQATQAQLASAFFLENVPYWWKPGVTEYVSEKQESANDIVLEEVDS